MRILADESCDFIFVRALRDAGHDVRAVAEFARGQDDQAILKLAVRAKRILLTEDKDFGQWIFAERRATAGVVFLRYPLAARRRMAESLVQFVEKYGDRLARSFVVIQPGRSRITPRL